MMSETEVVPTQEPAAEPSASDDLDALLNEYEEPVAAPIAAPVAEDPVISPDRLAAVEDFMARQDRQDTQTALSDSAAIFRTAAGESAEGKSNDELEGLVHLEAFRNPKIAQIFQDRFENPEKWSKTVQALGKKFSEGVSKSDPNATESWNAVDSAMHSAASAKSTEEKAPDVSKMTDQEFAVYKAGL